MLKAFIFTHTHYEKLHCCTVYDAQNGVLITLPGPQKNDGLRQLGFGWHPIYEMENNKLFDGWETLSSSLAPHRIGNIWGWVKTLVPSEPQNSW